MNYSTYRNIPFDFDVDHLKALIYNNSCQSSQKFAHMTVCDQYAIQKLDCGVIPNPGVAPSGFHLVKKLLF